MRIVFVSEAYPPTSGGVATSAQRVARNLYRLGCKVLVLTFDGSRPLTDNDYILQENDEGVEVRRIGPFFLKQPSVEAERLSEKIRAIFRRRAFDQMEKMARHFKPQVVLSFYVVNAGLLATYVARSLEVPHVVGVRGNDVGRNIFSVDRLAAVRLVVDGGARIVCVNEHLRKRLLLAFPETATRTSVIMNGIELPAGIPILRSREYLTANTGWNANDTVAVFIGSPREKKGISLLLQSVELARAQVPLRLLIVGPDIGVVERRQCGKQWDRLVTEGVLHVTGHLDRAAALRIASEGDIVAMPSIEDGLANGLLEGMALGLCPVVSDLFSGVVPNQECGWVATRNEPTQFSDALVQAVRSSPQRASFAAASKARVAERHVPRDEAAAYAHLFEEVITHACAR